MAHQTHQALELPQFVGYLFPYRLTFCLVDTRQHLVQGAERLALKAHALVGRGQVERGSENSRLYVAETGLPVRLFQHTRSTEAEMISLTCPCLIIDAQLV